MDVYVLFLFLASNSFSARQYSRYNVSSLPPLLGALFKTEFSYNFKQLPPILPSHWERIRQPKMKFITTLRSINLPGAVLWLGAPSTLTGCPFNPDLHNT